MPLEIRRSLIRKRTNFQTATEAYIELPVSITLGTNKIKMSHMNLQSQICFVEKAYTNSPKPILKGVQMSPLHRV